MGYNRFPLTPALSPGRGRMVLRLSINARAGVGPTTIWLNTQSDACCFPLPAAVAPERRLARREGGRERVRVRGKYSVEHAKYAYP